MFRCTLNSEVTFNPNWTKWHSSGTTNHPPAPSPPYHTPTGPGETEPEPATSAFISSTPQSNLTPGSRVYKSTTLDGAKLLVCVVCDCAPSGSHSHRCDAYMNMNTVARKGWQHPPSNPPATARHTAPAHMMRCWAAAC